MTVTSDNSFGHPNQMGAAANQLIEYQRLMNQLHSGGQEFYAGSHDWSDFNIHLTPLMQAVLCEEICRRVEKDIQHGPSLEKYRKIKNAETRALLNQFMHFADEIHKVVQGECSGIRATDLFNSLTNKVFYRMILRLLKALKLSVEESIAKTTHIGDDFDLLSRVPGLPPLITYLLSACGSKMNGLKQFISTKQIELLRRLVTPNSITAFLNRAVGNFFAPPVVQKIESFVERKTGEIESTAEMLRRGGCGPGVSSISDLLLVKLNEGSQEMDGEMSFVRVPVARALERGENGGLGCFSGFDSRFEVLIKKKYPRRIPNPREHTLTGFRDMPRFASSDLSSIITPTQRQVIEDAGIGLDRILNDVHQTIKQTSWPVGSRQLRNACVLASASQTGRKVGPGTTSWTMGDSSTCTSGPSGECCRVSGLATANRSRMKTFPRLCNKASRPVQEQAVAGSPLQRWLRLDSRWT